MAFGWEEDLTQYVNHAREFCLGLAAFPNHPPCRGSGACVPAAQTAAATEPICFRGSDAVSWMTEHGVCRTRGESVALGRHLLQDGVILFVSHRRNFEDGPLLYKLALPSADESVNRIRLVRFPAVARPLATPDIQEKHSSCRSSHSSLDFSELVLLSTSSPSIANTSDTSSIFRHQWHPV